MRSLVNEGVLRQLVNVGNLVVLQFPLVNLQLVLLVVNNVVLLDLVQSVRRITQQVQKLVHHQSVTVHLFQDLDRLPVKHLLVARGATARYQRDLVVLG